MIVKPVLLILIASADPSPSEQQRIDDARPGREDLQHHAADDDPAQEMRQVKQRLGNLLQFDGFPEVIDISSRQS